MNTSETVDMPDPEGAVRTPEPDITGPDITGPEVTGPEVTGPDITVLICLEHQRKRAERALQSLLRQQGIERAEILLLDLGAGRYPPLTGSAHASVRAIPLTSVRSLGEMVQIGVKAARAPIIAILEEHCVALPGWLEGLMAAFQSSEQDVVMSLIVNETDPFGRSHFSRLTDDIVFPHQTIVGSQTTIHVFNSAYRRAILESHFEQLSLLASNFGTFSALLRSQGLHLNSVAGVMVLHGPAADDWRKLRGDFYFNWAAMGVHAQTHGFSPVRRLVMAGLTPVVALVVALRLLRNPPASIAKAEYRRYWGSALANAFLNGLGNSFGLLFGPDGALDGQRNAEMNSRRIVAPLDEVLGRYSSLSTAVSSAQDGPAA